MRIWVRNMEKQMQIEEAKKQMRRQAKAKRDALSREDRAAWSKAVCSRLARQPFFQDAKTVCFYYPLGSEVNLLPLAEAALESGKRTAFPRVDGDRMDFCRIFGLEEFAEGAFHVMEPVTDELVGAEDALVLVPGLAFDECGGRMGYGKGYYDRYFSRYPSCRKVGICYEAQKEQEVPCGRYDIAMDTIVTEYGITEPVLRRIRG